MSPEQQRALAIARAKRARAEAQGAQTAPSPPAVGQDPLSASVTAGGQGITLGFGDELAAGLFTPVEMGMQAYRGDPVSVGGAYDAALDKTRGNLRDARENSPKASMAGELAGAAMIPGMATGGTLKTIAQGAGTGAAYGFGSGEGGVDERLKDAGTGALIGGTAGAVVRGVTNAVSNRTARAAVPSNDELRRLADQAYDAADAAGVVVAPQGIQRLGATIQNDLAEFGYHPNLQPRVGVVLNEIGRLSEGNVTFKGLDQVRRMAQAAASSQDRSEVALGTRIIGHIDDLMENLPIDETVTGNAGQASAAYRQARDYWSRMRKSEMVDTAVTKAERRAASTGTGGNSDNAIRQNVRGLLDNPRTARGFNATEREAAERVVRGTTPQNAARLVGRLSPQGNGLMAALGVGGAASIPQYAIPAMIAGAVGKQIADRATPRNVQALSEILRSGGQTAPQIARQAIAGQGGNQALIQALTQQQRVGGRAVMPSAALAAALLGQ